MKGITTRLMRYPAMGLIIQDNNAFVFYATPSLLQVRVNRGRVGELNMKKYSTKSN